MSSALQPSPGQDWSSEDPPSPDGARWLLWLSGAIAVAIGGAAFLLWGTRSGPFLLDLVAALCA